MCSSSSPICAWLASVLHSQIYKRPAGVGKSGPMLTRRVSGIAILQILSRSSRGSFENETREAGLPCDCEDGKSSGSGKSMVSAANEFAAWSAEEISFCVAALDGFMQIGFTLSSISSLLRVGSSPAMS